MSDVVALLSTLTDEKGKVLIPGVNDSVRELTPEEEALYDDLDFDMVRIFLCQQLHYKTKYFYFKAIIKQNDVFTSWKLIVYLYRVGVELATSRGHILCHVCYAKYLSACMNLVCDI